MSNNPEIILCKTTIQYALAFIIIITATLFIAALIKGPAILFIIALFLSYTITYYTILIKTLSIVELSMSVG